LIRPKLGFFKDNGLRWPDGGLEGLSAILYRLGCGRVPVAPGDCHVRHAREPRPAHPPSDGSGDDNCSPVTGSVSAEATAAEPPRDCPRCPRLVAYREHWRAQEPGWHNAPVPCFGADGARLLIVGLAPGLRGANRTGRPFTGDYAGELLYATLKKFGLATGEFLADPHDSLQLVNTLIDNAVRCVPPQNKPTPAEIRTCRQFLTSTLETYRPPAYLALGRIAHDSLLSALGERKALFPFRHGAEHALSAGGTLYDSYLCSRYNTNTGVLTTAMFEDVVGRAARAVEGVQLTGPRGSTSSP